MLGTVSGSVLQLVAPYASRRLISGPDLAYAAHHYLIYVAAVSADLVGMFVDLRSTGISKVVTTGTAVAFPCRLNGPIIEIICVVVHLARSGSRQSSHLKLLIGHAFAHLLANALQLFLNEIRHRRTGVRVTQRILEHLLSAQSSSRLRCPLCMTADSYSTQHLDVGTELVVAGERVLSLCHSHA